MTRPDPFEAEILDAYEGGKLKSVATKDGLNPHPAKIRVGAAGGASVKQRGTGDGAEGQEGTRSPHGGLRRGSALRASPSVEP